jgi:hypothetical protein
VTVTVQNPYLEYVANGIANTYIFNFTILEESDLRVFVDDVQQVLGIDYNIQNLTSAGGDVVFVVPPADTLKVVLARSTSRDQQVDYQPFDAFPADTHEFALDKLTLIVQELEVATIPAPDWNDHLNDFNNPHHVTWDQIEGTTDDVLTQFTDLLGEAWPSGLYDGGELNVGPGPNDLEILAGAGVIIDSYTDPLGIPTRQSLSWNQINTPITAAPAVAGSIVRILIADGGVPGPISGTNLGVLVQQGFPATPSQLRDQLFLGVYIHNGAFWKDVSSPVVVNNGVVSFNEYSRQVNGPAYVEGGGQVSEAALFTLDREAGSVWEMNRNWHVNKKDPNREAFPEQLNFQWRYTNRDFTDVGALTGTADPTQYDDGGTVSPVPGGTNVATIQRVYVDIGDNYWVLWGQNTYDNYVEAVASIGADTAATEIPHLLGGGSILLGYIVAEQGKTDWDNDEARFVSVQAALGGGATLPVQTFLDLNDTPTDYVGDARKVPQVTAAEDALEFVTPVRWRNVWADGEYYNGDMVLDFPYTMIANKTTTDKPAPQDVGGLNYILPDVPTWANFANTSLVGSGHSYAFTETVEVHSIRVWPPTIGANIEYRLVLQLGNSISQRVLTNLTAGQWNILGSDPLIVPSGSTLLAYLETENSGSSTQVTGGWTRGLNSNNVEPANANWNRNNNNNVVRIDFDDLDTVNRQSELEGIIVGSTIQFVETAIPANFIIYRVVANPVTLTTSVSYSVVEIDRGIAEPTVGQNCTMTADIPIAASTDFVGIVNGWVGNEPVYADVTSALFFDGVDQGADPDNQYGVDIAVQRLSISPDWDFVAKSTL